MGHYRNRLVASIANRLGAMMGNGALYGVEGALREACNAFVLHVAGARIEHRCNLPVVILADGTEVAGVDDRSGDDAIEAALEQWKASGHPPRELARALPLASGAEAIAAAMGQDVDRMCALAYAFGFDTLERDGALLTIHNHGHRLHATYTRGRLRWEDGIANVPSGPLPQSLRMALSGRTLSSLVSDPMVGGRIIARVVDADPRERIVRVHTTDAGKFI